MKALSMCTATTSPSVSHAFTLVPSAPCSWMICDSLHSNETGLSATRGTLTRLPGAAVRPASPEEEIDHLVDSCGRLVDGLRNHLRVEEAHHTGAGAERRQRQVGRVELARGNAVGDDLADNSGAALDMGDADVPILFHRD